MCHGVAFFQVLPPGRSRNRRSFPWRIQSQEEKPNWAVILVDRPLTIPRLRCPHQTGCCNLRAVLSPPYSRNGAASRSGELPPAGSGTRRERSERHRQGDPDRRGHPVAAATAADSPHRLCPNRGPPPGVAILLQRPQPDPMAAVGAGMGSFGNAAPGRGSTGPPDRGPPPSAPAAHHRDGSARPRHRCCSVRARPVPETNQ